MERAGSLDRLPALAGRRHLGFAGNGEAALARAQGAPGAPGHNLAEQDHSGDGDEAPHVLFFLVFGMIGNTIENVEPRPGFDSHCTSPLCA